MERKGNLLNLSITFEFTFLKHVRITPVLLQCEPGGHGRQSPLLCAPGEAR